MCMGKLVGNIVRSVWAICEAKYSVREEHAQSLLHVLLINIRHIGSTQLSSFDLNRQQSIRRLCGHQTSSQCSFRSQMQLSGGMSFYIGQKDQRLHDLALDPVSTQWVGRPRLRLRYLIDRSARRISRLVHCMMIARRERLWGGGRLQREEVFNTDEERSSA